MLYIKNNNNSPHFNLALEEYLVKNFNEDFFMLWRDYPCVVVGKNQNTLSEVKIDYIEKYKIPVIRRLSGGGAVFHNLGNINFTFISNKSDSFNDYKKFTKPIIDVLNKLGVKAEFSGRNDITIEGKKISGNAQYEYKGRVLHHGTLLFSSTSQDVSKFLKVKESKFKDKAVKSVNARVTNIQSHLKQQMNIEEFINILLDHVSSLEGAKEYKITEEDINNINKLMEEKYLKWEWNFGKSPKYNFNKEVKYPGGLLEMFLFVDKGIIKEINIKGDFFSKFDVSNIENALVGVQHKKDAIIEILSLFNIQDYFSNISLEEVVNAMF